jgi:hypothetical protein
LSTLVQWYIYSFNPFKLPTYNDLHGISSYSAPPLYFLIEKGILVICPGHLIQFFFMDCTNGFLWVTWGVGAVLNGFVYFGLGCALSALLGLWKS